mmetsp:Transcript_20788/g.58102  ORF Transcript_20788/g.58102 Transcript_20788/m.58102 type:complete len:266 (+) Transcript_20788:571-1368(+)
MKNWSIFERPGTFGTSTPITIWFATVTLLSSQPILALAQPAAETENFVLKGNPSSTVKMSFPLSITRSPCNRSSKFPDFFENESRTVQLKSGAGIETMLPMISYLTDGSANSYRPLEVSTGRTSQPSEPIVSKILPPERPINLANSSGSVFTCESLGSTSTFTTRFASAKPGASGNGSASRFTPELSSLLASRASEALNSAGETSCAKASKEGFRFSFSCDSEPQDRETACQLLDFVNNLTGSGNFHETEAPITSSPQVEAPALT